MSYSHELIMPNQDLPFKMFLFEGKNGNYIRENHWHRSIEIFAVFEGSLEFSMNEGIRYLKRQDFVIVNSNEVHAIKALNPNRTVVLQIPLKMFEVYYTDDQFIRFEHDVCEQNQELMKSFVLTNSSVNYL